LKAARFAAFFSLDCTQIHRRSVHWPADQVCAGLKKRPATCGPRWSLPFG